MFKLPDGKIVSGEGYTFIGDVQYPLRRMTPAERAAIGVEDYSPPVPPNVDPRFYYVSQIGDPVPRSMQEIRRWMKKQVRDQARVVTERFIRNYGHDVAFALDKLADAILDGATLTQNQKDRTREAIVRLRRLTRLENDKKQKEIAIEALVDVAAAETFNLDISSAEDVEDADL